VNITIKSNIRNYDVFFESSFSFIDDLQSEKDPIFVIDQNVYSLYRKELEGIPRERLFLFNAIEENKTFDYIKEVYDFLLSKSVKRNSTFISIGGGITQDITGFVASTFFRGLNWVFVPTTFLAMTDSCIGSKTSVNYDKHKNLMGTFYPPSKIYINKDFLLTLKELDFFSGIGETIKFQLMEESYPKNFESILAKVKRVVADDKDRNTVILENMNIKKSYMEGDEFDLGRRNLLNYGHCFGHALETSSGYYVPHGIAVNIGMVFANCISEARGLITSEDSDFVNHSILVPNVPLTLRDQDFDASILLESMKNDKKRVGEFLSVIIPSEEFRMIKVNDVTDMEFETALDNTYSIFFRD
jgi:3-dehydroquinate synthase